LAQDLVAKKCGILEEDQSLEAMTLQNYLDHYKQPLTDYSLEAKQKLTEVVVEKKKRRNKKPNQSKAQEQASKKDLNKKKKHRVVLVEATA
jgi:hypothetical protein